MIYADRLGIITLLALSSILLSPCLDYHQSLCFVLVCVGLKGRVYDIDTSIHRLLHGRTYLVLPCFCCYKLSEIPHPTNVGSPSTITKGCKPRGIQRGVNVPQGNMSSATPGLLNVGPWTSAGGLHQVNPLCYSDKNRSPGVDGRTSVPYCVMQSFREPNIYTSILGWRIELSNFSFSV